MSTGADFLAGAVIVGLGATLFMDVWALFLKHAFNIPLADYCLVGRWLRHVPEGKFMHASIAAAPQKRSECAVGWVAHYAVGTVYALVLVAIAPAGWLAQPTLLPPLLFGVGSVLVPYLIMQPSFGLGIAASRTPMPAQASATTLSAGGKSEHP